MGSSMPVQKLDGPIEALLQAGGLAHAVAQVVELGSTGLAAPHHLDLGDTRGMYQEYTLNADALKDFPNGDGAVDAAIPHGNHSALIGLNPLFAALLDPHTHSDRIADMNDRQIRLEVLCFNGADNLLSVHSFCKNSQSLIVAQSWAYSLPSYLEIS